MSSLRSRRPLCQQESIKILHTMTFTSPILLYKPPGPTPYQAILQLKTQYPELRELKISPAGRLDPMAEGLLILLVGPDNKNQAQYLQYPKVYQATALFGLGTDTHDLLGLPHLASVPDLSKLSKAIQAHTGLIQQPYPLYSAVQVNGQPLHHWAKHHQTNNLIIPSRPRTIHQLTVTSQSNLNHQNLLQDWLPRLDRVQGDFRQRQIKTAWQELLGTPATYQLLHLTVHCSSGTYIRSLIHSIGQHLGSDALALTIKRTQVGPYHLHQALHLPDYRCYLKTNPQ